MQNRQTSWWTTQHSKGAILMLVAGALVLGVAQTSRANERPPQSSETGREERFLQHFISNALDQKRLAPEPLASTDTVIPEERENAPAASSRRQPDVGPVLWQEHGATGKMILGLAAILAVLGITLWVVRRYLLKPSLFNKRDNPLRILARVNLTPKAAVALLETPGNLLVIGVTGSTLTALGELPLTALDLTPGKPEAPSTSFAVSLDQAATSTNGEPVVDDPLLHVPERIQRRVSALKQL